MSLARAQAFTCRRYLNDFLEFYYLSSEGVCAIVGTAVVVAAFSAGFRELAWQASSKLAAGVTEICIYQRAVECEHKWLIGSARADDNSASRQVKLRSSKRLLTQEDHHAGRSAEAGGQERVVIVDIGFTFDRRSLGARMEPSSQVWNRKSGPHW